jgi:hypothetical protein
VVTIPQRVQQRTLPCFVRAESSTRHVTVVLAPLLIWLSSLRPLVVSYGEEAATLFAAGSRLVRRLEDSGDVEPAIPVVVRSLAELAFDMCPSEATYGLLNRLAIHLDPAALASPSFHLAFQCRILVRYSEQLLSSNEKTLRTAAAACWTDTAASTFTDHQQHDSTEATKQAHRRPADRRMSTERTSSATRRDRGITIARTHHQDNGETLAAAAA